ncbi:amidase [Zalerion maritima]|uniref:amidase n=1 Tax=Zalerion maritima TaxID=339359 RepID=A0AAD5RGB2_9PEZI|nr:amidase [Zalerion maritima]
MSQAGRKERGEALPYLAQKILFAEEGKCSLSGQSGPRNARGLLAGYQRQLHSALGYVSFVNWALLQLHLQIPFAHESPRKTMSFILGLSRHRAACKRKQDERAEIIRDLIMAVPPFGDLVSDADVAIINKPIAELVHEVQSGQRQAGDLLFVYGKVALKAHEKTNCLTEVMISESRRWLKDGSINFEGPLAGIPISLKDTLGVAGFDSSVGYSSFVGKPFEEDGPMVKMLKDMGAVPYVKTNVPISLLSFESTNDVWGRCTNPHNKKYSPGGSTGGESALLALGGRIGIGSDVAGSVRAPAHFAGIYSLRCSTGRWPRTGGKTSMPGQEGVPAVYSPMTRTMDDLAYFTRSLLQAKPWKYDYTCHPLEWRSDMELEFAQKKKFRVGVMRTDGVVDPSPACARALTMVEEALKSEGHEIVEIDPPSPFEGLVLASILLNTDGCQMFRSFMQPGEWLDAGARQMVMLMEIPRPIKYLYYLWVKYVRKDDIWAELIRDWHEKSSYETWQLVAKRELYRSRWFEWWNKTQLDFIISPPNATPAVPHDGMKEAVASCGYTFLFNLLDYTAGVFPVTHVDKDLDKLPADFQLNKLNGVAQGAYKLYDATDMHGLPVGVQVIGRRLEEEKVVSLMKRIEEILPEKYELLDPRS